ncbi:fatty acid desaturase family protein [Streptantibioticus silvisoli]|uniref:Acyl-CoA desaturase n=1 Tax=Streptantibioticus silvisoli TaxID=2705255 RepID=A0ABT6W9K8_9ACTN|nr:acyl-CoA desaturase [Streptantibioticus silvisoli]MDI5967453.1 acyl-CoA desaturase [Streptantibioticus silvisoli]
MPLSPVPVPVPGGGPAVRPAAGSEFAPLLRLVRDSGLLRRRGGRYAVEIGVNALALAGVWAAVVAVGGSWWALWLAVPMALLGGRTAFIGHDAGHQQIAGGRRVNRLLGLIHGDLLLGMGYGWWNDKHNRHHAHPNHVGKDPDVEVGALVWTRAQAVDRAGFARFLTKYQAWLFFPMLLLEGLALKVASVRDLARRPAGERRVEGALLAAHAVGYVALLAWAMPPGIAVAFAVLHHALFGLHLGASFAPNHKGMDMPGDGDEHRGHLRRQVLTSRNVRGGRVTDWFLGGLNYQVEHHLFPSMPRHRLRRAQPLVRAYCARIGVPYTEAGLLDSYRQAMRHMHAVGADLRRTDRRR